MQCPSCGEDNTERAKFCLNCATPLVGAAAPRELRKTVTIVFSDVTGSTSIGERLDPETLRRVMERYFDEMRSAIERHGGMVEKFIGDAVMAVFGIPRTHEEDALRAVRAAVAMDRARDALNIELARDYGVEIIARTGINTGEVVANVEAGERQRLVTGDTVNVAARLEQAAPPGEILLGRETYRLVRDAVEVEQLEPLKLKGKSEPMPAFRLLSLDEAAIGIARRDDVPFVGRDRERRALAEAYDRSVREPTSALFTVLGIAGVGKSRLVAEVLSELTPEPLVLSGRCLPYGEGITYWAVIEIIKQAAAIEESDPPDVARDKIRALVRDEAEAGVIESSASALLSLAPQPGSVEEIQWAIRRLLETLASTQPLTVVFDDLHWAEPALLDLIEHVADFSRDAPILLTCLARPEFLDERPGWGGGKMNATTILLEPLDERDTSTLVTELLGDSDLDAATIARIGTAAEGNPLFVEEMLSMLLDEGVLARSEEGRLWQIRSLVDLELPTSIQVLLAARLDRLESSELSLVEAAAVVGQVFYRDAVAELSPEALRPDVATHLRALVRKDLIRPERGGFPGDESYRFRHILLRDAAYRAMPKETRAKLHERFADWLERMAGERIAEYEEIVAYHLEQAYRYGAELGHSGVEVEPLRDRTVKLLTQVGTRALERGDVGGATALLNRGLELSPPGGAVRAEILLALGETLVLLARYPDAEDVLEDALSIAGANGDEVVRARARLRLLIAKSFSDVWTNDMSREARQLEAVFTGESDHGELARLFRLFGYVEMDHGQYAAAQEELRRARAEADLARNRSQEALAISNYVLSLALGPTPVNQAIAEVKEILDSGASNLELRTGCLEMLGHLLALAGQFDAARPLFVESRALAFESGRIAIAYRDRSHAGTAELLAGDPVAAEQELREGYLGLKRLGDAFHLSAVAPFLARAVLEQGRIEEARELVLESEGVTSETDIVPRVVNLSIHARVLHAEASLAEAERMARDAVELAATTDAMIFHADALVDLAETLGNDREQERAEVLRSALDLYEAKGVLPMIARLRQGRDRARHM
jgi:class 3 adenylate cyclase/tetratricopeptide (TPR) repeat protein